MNTPGVIVPPPAVGSIPSSFRSDAGFAAPGALLVQTPDAEMELRAVTRGPTNRRAEIEAPVRSAMLGSLQYSSQVAANSNSNYYKPIWHRNQCCG